MQVLLYGGRGSKVKTFKQITTWEKVAETIFTNIDFEDDVFIVLTDDNKILYKAIFDYWKEKQFLNFNGVQIEI